MPKKQNRVAAGVAAVLPALILFLGGGVASAATTTAPYTSSGTAVWCNPTSACTTSVRADHVRGELAVDVVQRGGVSYEPGACTGSFVCRPEVGDAWGSVSAFVVASQNVGQPVSAVDFTVTVGTGNATATTEGTSASASVTLTVDARGDSCATCGVHVSETLASSTSSVSAAPSTRTLHLRYADSRGGKVPPGTVRVSITLGGYTTGGLGSTARAQATAVVNSVTSTPRA